MNPFFKSGQTVLFQGDSITDCDRDRSDPASLSEGYPGRVATIYNTLFPDNGVTFVNRGVSGDRVRNLVERYEEDFKAVNPDFVSILIGINDTWRNYDSNDKTTTAEFENTYITLLERIKKDMPKAQIMLIEPFVLNTDPARACWRQEDLGEKIDVVRNLARKYADYFLPLDGIFVKEIVSGYTDEQLSGDGVHPTPQGHAIIALKYLKVLGVL